MSMKGTITISGDDLLKMKARANILPNGISSLTQPMQRKIAQVTNCNRVKSAQISGQTTQSISSSERKKSALKSSRRKNWSEDVLMRKSVNFNRSSRNKNWQKRMLNCSKTQSKFVH